MIALPHHFPNFVTGGVTATLSWDWNIINGTVTVSCGHRTLTPVKVDTSRDLSIEVGGPVFEYVLIQLAQDFDTWVSVYRVQIDHFEIIAILEPSMFMLLEAQAFSRQCVRRQAVAPKFSGRACPIRHFPVKMRPVLLTRPAARVISRG